MSRQFTLSKTERLKSRKLIEKIFSGGNRFMSGPFRVHWMFFDTAASGKAGSKLLFGVGVPAKNFRKATDRNRIKRFAREAYRQQKKSLGDKLASGSGTMGLFLVFTGREKPQFGAMKEAISNILEMLEKRADENRAAHT